MASFSDLLRVDTIDSHTYRVKLVERWAIGSVPHGGAVTSVLQAVAKQHFLTTLQSQNQPDCITLHVDFVQRTSIGPAVVRVKDVKLGRQTSTVQVTLTQDGRDEVIAMLTHANMAAESGLSLPTAWSLNPKPRTADLPKLAADGTDGFWKLWATPVPEFRKAALNMHLYLPNGGRTARGVMDQWIRFKNGERFTNSCLGMLSDMFPQMVDTYSEDREAIDEVGLTQKDFSAHWYPTVTLNLDVKKLLPESGVEWVFVRIQSKVISNGRKDLEVIIMNERGEVVALSHHVALIVSATRNLAKRGEGKKGRSEPSRL
ncbi:thioesterase-like superfamily-domain-containing protein [Xylariales sp. AK1849]|nr:thioesterase-like superfamily-domain-containing protein [Xylariales sp. AK1849]